MGPIPSDGVSYPSLPTELHNRFVRTLLEAQAAPYDPNWYLSTTVQSAAALVAIIGGFLISRLISTISEKSTLQNHLADLDSRKKISQAAADVARRKIQARTDDWFLDEHLKEIIDSNGILDIAKLVDNFWGRGHDPELTQKFAQKLADITARAFKEILEVYGSNTNPPDNCDELREAGISIGDDEEELVYLSVANSLVKAKAEKNTAWPFAFSQAFTKPLLMPPITPPHVQARHDANIANELDLKTTVALIDGEISLIKSRLPVVSDPKPFLWGFVVLAYFAAVGIFYPLHFMTKLPVIAPSGVRTQVYFGFISGFVVLLLYIANDVVKMRRNSMDTSLSGEDLTQPRESD